MTASPGEPAAERRLPTGTVTFLRTDIEGSMGLTRALGPAWDAVNERHLAILRAAIAGHGGSVVRTEGDAVFAVFGEAGAAVAAAADAQRALFAEPWPAGAPVRARMGLHAGEAHLAGDDYGGFDVSRAARVASTGHGGQVILSGPTQELVADRLPPGTELHPLGTFVLKDVGRPEALFQLDIAGLPSAFPPVRAGRTVAGNLDGRLTSFVGREREVDALRDLVERHRLVTLTGPGGIGKSSLAVELARSIEQSYPDGAWFVPLASVDAADAVEPLIARTIGLFDGPFRPAVETLPIFTAERSMLFVLDNFEHVVDAVDVVSRVLRHSPRSRVIVTSRAPLHLTGEQEYPVGPLGVGAADDSARRLFIERASAVRPGWDPGPEASAVDEIVALLDGLPLGIELAAARVALLPPASIRDRLASRLPLPGSGPRDAPTRQRTLDGAVAWSHDLLTPALQMRFHRLSVFDGSFDLEQAGPVAVGDDPGSADILDDLAELVDRSLVQRAPEGPGVRFRLLRTIQSFAAARLDLDGQEEATRRRHAETYTDLAEVAQRHEVEPDSADWLVRLSVDEANLRAAVSWAIEHDEADLALRLVGALWRYWQADGHLNEGRAFAERALAMPGADAPTSARMWAAAAAGSIAYWQSDPERARSWYREQLALAETLGDAAGEVDARFNLGHVSFIETSSAAELTAGLEDVRHRYEALGDERGVARTRWAAGNLALEGGDVSGATQSFLASRQRFEELGDRQYVALSSGSLAWATFAAGDVPSAVRWTSQAMTESFARRDHGSTAISLHVGVLIAVIVGRPDEAARLSGAFDALCDRYGVRPPAALERFIHTQDPFAMARAALPAERFASEYAAGQRMTLAEAVDLVVELASGPIPGAQ